MVGRFSAGRQVIVFLLLAFGITWVVWVPRARVHSGVLDSELAVTLGTFWTYGPAVAAVVAAAITGRRPALADLGRRLVRWRVGWRWWAVVLAGPGLLTLAIAALHVSFGGRPGDVQPLAMSAGLAAALPLLAMLCLTDGLGEETGWRGFALPRLLEITSPVVASLLLGVVWALWHLPLYWTQGTPLYRSPILLLFLDLPATAVLYTWVFQHTGGSVLLAVVLHGTLNLLGVPIPTDGEGALVPYLLFVAVKLVAAVGIMLAARQLLHENSGRSSHATAPASSLLGAPAKRAGRYR